MPPPPYTRSYSVIPEGLITIYAPMIFTAPCIMFWMRAYPFTRGSGRGLGPGIREFFGPYKMHRANRRVPFGAQKT